MQLDVPVGTRACRGEVDVYHHPLPPQAPRQKVCAKVREIRGSTYAAEVDNYELPLPPLLLLRRSTGREKKRAAEKFT